jgi:hypothetical protein
LRPEIPSAAQSPSWRFSLHQFSFIFKEKTDCVNICSSRAGIYIRKEKQPPFDASTGSAQALRLVSLSNHRAGSGTERAREEGKEKNKNEGLMIIIQTFFALCVSVAIFSFRRNFVKKQLFSYPP